MKISAVVLAGLVVPVLLSAAEAPTAVLAPILAAQDDEPRVMSVLKGVVVLPAPPAPGAAPPTDVAGVDASRVPLLDIADFRLAMAPFIDQPASLRSIDRMEGIIRAQLQILGYPLANVYAPPQDVTAGVLRVVVQLATLEGEKKVSGARWFSARSYVNAVRVKTGVPLDLPAVNADVAWLNRNPFRRVTASAEAGAQPATTRLVLDTRERLPLELDAGYSNSGTAITDTNRISAGLLWGNALGRGDLVRYGYTADPASRYLRSHSGSYTAFLPWRQILTLQGGWTHLTADLPAPLAQSGTSWQAGAVYEIPLAAPRPGWTQDLSFTGDFKYSDNTLEFAAIPITGNVTHIVQFGVNYGVAFPAAGGRNSVSFSAEASPGGLTGRNHSHDFAGSRPGAKADYVYGRVSLVHRHPLPAGFGFSTAADLQVASGALLGTEQLNGGGSGAARGYRDNSAFGDAGVVINNELHAPGFSLLKGRDLLDAFGFFDVASLNLKGDDESTDLRSVGFGINYQLGRVFSVRAAYGWQLKYLDRTTDKSRGHVSAMLTW